MSNTRTSYRLPGINPVTIAFTKTEFEIMKRIWLPDKHIADDMNISPHTVSTHSQNIRKKTWCKSKGELIYYATKKGYLA